MEASQPEQQARTRITPDNYSFLLVGVQQIAGREAFVIDLEPKTDNRYLTRGRIWVDACDFAIMRMEGAPAHKVSFWAKNVNFVQTFEKNGTWWLPESNHSLTEARLFGLAELTCYARSLNAFEHNLGSFAVVPESSHACRSLFLKTFPPTVVLRIPTLQLGD